MGRYRAPPPKASPYITEFGYAKLGAELKALWDKRIRVTAALSAAAAEGDRSENAEYIYRKKQLREIDYRIRYLQKRLPILNIIKQAPQNQDQIFFGAWVTLEDEQGKQTQYRIVGSDEFHEEKAYISLDSPLAQALLKHHIDDEIKVTTPNGLVLYNVVEIRYDKLSN